MLRLASNFTSKAVQLNNTKEGLKRGLFAAAAAAVVATNGNTGLSQSAPIHLLASVSPAHKPRKGTKMSGEIVDFEGTPSASRKIRIYTRTGDKGKTSLYTGERRAKDDAIFEALGTVDELTSTLGLALEYCESNAEALSDLRTKLEEIQSRLQDLNSNIATPRNSAALTEERLKKTEFDTEGSWTMELEKWIDVYDDELPQLRQFILPSGGLAASTIHVARTICRRAERRVVSLVEQGIASASCQKYLNRLSDFLFTAARYASHKAGKKDRIYVKRGESA